MEISNDDRIQVGRVATSRTSENTKKSRMDIGEQNRRKNTQNNRRELSEHEPKSMNSETKNPFPQAAAVEPTFQASFKRVFHDNEPQTKIGYFFFKLVEFTVNCKIIVDVPRRKPEFQWRLLIFKKSV